MQFTPSSAVPAPALPRESIGSVLAKNLIVARLLTGLTQQELADTAGVSRATIAQLETGVSDPRLSTVRDIAAAFGIPPLFLLVGESEVRALAALRDELAQRPLSIDRVEVARMRHFVASGLLKDRGRAARVGASVARTADAPRAVPLAAGLFSAALPGDGTAVGAALGRLLA